ncbi:TonB-dependent receptor plug domain-containing protein [Derxia lacustris]|uniref:TonB-dependent receptor plug domain-containing protein n=1 Tax=Derxia lacustris TaxID=764842 RepID=UPI000A16DEA7|nr:TonB-dependent receptor [Derxia lacustris]
MHRNSAPPGSALRLRRLRACCGLLAVLLMAGARGADDPTELSLEELAVEPVFSGSKFPQRRADVPGAVSIITADDIRANGWRSFDEVLGALRGVFVSNDHAYHYLSARGFGRPGEYNPRFLFLLDGQRLNEDVFGQAPVGRDLPVDVGLIERVEFISGPGSASFGSGAFIGTVNIVTREPAALPGPRALLGLGSDATREARASWGGTLADGAVSLMLAAGQYRADGTPYRFPELDDRFSPGGRSAAAADAEHAGNLYLKLRAGESVLSVSANRRDKRIPTALYRTVFGAPELDSHDERTQIGAHSLWRPLADLRIGLDAGWLTLRGRGDYPYGFDIGTARQGYANDRATLELRADWSGWAGHRLTGGVEVKRDFTRSQSAGGQHFMRSHDFPDTLLSFYLEDQWRLTPHWLLDFGARRDHPLGETGQQLSPRGALIWQPGPSTSFKLVASRAYRYASEFERAFLPQVLGGPILDLAAESIRNLELVAEHYMSNNWRAQASLWHYRADRLIGTRAVDPSLTIVSGDGRRHGHGADVETEFAFDDGARMRASLAWQQVDGGWGTPPPDAAALADWHPQTPFPTAGVSLPPGAVANAPRWTGSTQFSRPIGFGAARAALELRALSARMSPNGATAPGRLVVSCNLSELPLARGVSLDLGVFNLFDRRSWDVASADNVDVLGRRLDRIPLDGRLLRAQLRMEF